MSQRARTWAKLQQPGSITRKAVLNALADAHSTRTGRCSLSTETICADTGACDRSVRQALAELETAGYISRDRRREADGKLGIYEYALRMNGAAAADAAGPPAASAITPPAASAKPPAADAGQVLEVQDLELDLNQDLNQDLNLKPLPPNPPSAALATTTKAPPAVLVDGRNLAFDALVEVCNVDVRNKTQRGRLTRALKEIREYFWEEVQDAARDVTPEEYEAALARAVRARANEYDARFSDVVMTPNALSTWWHQMARPSTGRHATTAADRARIVAGPNLWEAMREHFQGGDSDDS